MSDPQSADRQRTRVPLEGKVSLVFKELRGFLDQYAGNISLGGMFLRTANPQPPGTVFHFELALADGTGLLQGIGEVVWMREQDEAVERPAGMGIRFRQLDPQSRA
ncbi:MAG TPA: TIGR02266 family protein, partial [Thermoanaerobaculia bacterium]|nr:TIGR02266 family protein [Thermoanaerobaculia bacterium]